MYWPTKIAALNKNILRYTSAVTMLTLLNKVMGKYNFGLILSHTKDFYDKI